MEKFKNCLATVKDAYEYDVEIDGAHFAKCRSLNYKDKLSITAKSQVKVDGDEKFALTSYAFQTVLASLVAWEIDAPITEENLGKFWDNYPEYYAQLQTAVLDRVSKMESLAQDNEKN